MMRLDTTLGAPTPPPLRRLLGAALGLSAAMLEITARAETIRFRVDPERSQLTISGSVVKFGLNFNLNYQVEGSLRSAVAGFIPVELGSNSIRFLDDGGFTFLDSGVWEPGLFGAEGSAPACWGGRAGSDLGAIKIAGVLAGRHWGLAAASTNLTLTADEFTVRPLRFHYRPAETSVLDYRFLTSYRDVDPDDGPPVASLHRIPPTKAREPVLSAGRFILDGVWTNRTQLRGRLVSEEGFLTLTIPMEAWTVFEGRSEAGEVYRFHWILTGQLVGLALPPVKIERAGDQLRVQVSSGLRLQRATRLSPSDWTDFAAPADGLLSNSADQEFFRAVRAQ